MESKIKSNFTEEKAKPEIKPEVKDACGDVIEEPIDVVYTWVNGSDPEFIKELESVLGKYSKLRIQLFLGYIDVSDICLRQNMLVTTITYSL